MAEQLDPELAERFEEHRTHLRAVAYRMLGSVHEADDAVQETWLRLGRTDATVIENLGGWLTTVVGRICLDQLRKRGTRAEDSGADVEAQADVAADDPERDALLADAVGPALLVVLDELAPPERLAFVLHDVFGVPFDEIAVIVDRTPAAARQLASRGRRRVQGAGAPEADVGRQREVVDAFLAASRSGDFAALLELLDPDVVARADEATVAMGSDPIVRGATTVAQTFVGRAKGAAPAMIDGRVGLVWAMGGQPKVAFDLTIVDGRIRAIDLLSDPETLAALDLDLDV